MRLFAIALAVSVASAGLVVACSPSGEHSTQLDVGKVDQYGNTVYLSDTPYERSVGEQNEVELTQSYIGNKQSCEQGSSRHCALMKENEAALWALQSARCKYGDSDACEVADPSNDRCVDGDPANGSPECDRIQDLRDKLKTASPSESAKIESEIDSISISIEKQYT
jgi:hypothetical protein